MKSFLATCGLSIALFTSAAHAVVVPIAEYHLGEAGSLGTGNRPQDSSGFSHHFTGLNGAAATVSSSVEAPGSTASLTDSGSSGYFGSAVGGSVTDNFAIDLWAKTSATTQVANVFYGNAENNGSLKFTISGGNWRTSYHNNTFIGGTAPVAADEWTRLTVIRYGGLSSFYIDGVQIGVATATVPSNPALNFIQFHLSVAPGGGSGFTGSYDEMRIFTFNPATDSMFNVSAAVFGIPEPATASLALLGLGGLMLRRRRMA